MRLIQDSSDHSTFLRFGAIQLLKQLVGLVEATHGIQGATGIRMMFEGHLSIGIPDLGQCHPLAWVRGELELAQGPLEGHGGFQRLEGCAPLPSSESVDKSVHQGGNPEREGFCAKGIFQNTSDHHDPFQARGVLTPAGTAEIPHQPSRGRPREYLALAKVCMGPDVMGQPAHGGLHYGGIGGLGKKIEPVGLCFLQTLLQQTFRELGPGGHAVR